MYSHVTLFFLGNQRLLRCFQKPQKDPSRCGSIKHWYSVCLFQLLFRVVFGLFDKVFTHHQSRRLPFFWPGSAVQHKASFPFQHDLHYIWRYELTCWSSSEEERRCSLSKLVSCILNLFFSMLHHGCLDIPCLSTFLSLSSSPISFHSYWSKHSIGGMWSPHKSKYIINTVFLFWLRGGETSAPIWHLDFPRAGGILRPCPAHGNISSILLSQDPPKFTVLTNSIPRPRGFQTFPADVWLRIQDSAQMDKNRQLKKWTGLVWLAGSIPGRPADTDYNYASHWDLGLPQWD